MSHEEAIFCGAHIEEGQNTCQATRNILAVEACGKHGMDYDDVDIYLFGSTDYPWQHWECV
jgi:hypothetical protein